jgi:Tol biopolymer transport system component
MIGVLRQTEDRIQQKAVQAQAGVKDIAARGHEPAPILHLLDGVKPALDAGDAKKAEGLLDDALKTIAQDAKTAQPGSAPPLPVFDVKVKESRLFVDPQPVTIAGYDGSAMEPFISPDGRFLFFNNENDPKVNTNLYFAERTAKATFRFLGEVPGVNSPSLDAVPSLDATGHFYFTTLREYDRTMNSIYTGDFDGKRVANVRLVKGDISPRTPFRVNMDACISADGKTLYISRAVIVPGAPAPRKSELMVARMKDGAFTIDPDSSRIMDKVNAGPLAYAPAISADGLELYFTWASMTASGPQDERAQLRIMVAMRRSADEPFSEPRVLSALTGYVEAPSISSDGRELFFHKKVGNKFIIYRAVRTVDR